MKIARFVFRGREVNGKFENGLLMDEDGREYNPEEVRWLPPVEPRNIICLALNYGSHAKEMNLQTTEEPVLFMKPVSSIIAHKELILKPKNVKFMHYEGELAVVIGRKCKNVKAKDAFDYVLGYTIANDVTARDFITNMFRPPIKAKGFDTFCPVGPVIVTQDEIGDVNNLKITTRVNKEVKQDSNTSMMIHKVDKVIEFISSFMTLTKGDLILTGTPEGISPLRINDVVEITIDKIGTLENKVIEEH